MSPISPRRQSLSEATHTANSLWICSLAKNKQRAVGELVQIASGQQGQRPERTISQSVLENGRVAAQIGHFVARAFCGSRGRPFASTVSLFAPPTVMFAQNAQSPTLVQVLGPQLIAWSKLQPPQPVTQALADRAIRKAKPEPLQGFTSEHFTRTQANGQAPQSPATFMGLISVVGGRYLLQLANNATVQLDDRERARQYSGTPIRIGGTPDESGKNLHLMSIELDS